MCFWLVKRCEIANISGTRDRGRPNKTLLEIITGFKYS